ncbi:hypothetical protein GJAV_G00263730 [Gymnothorax javanicus]|nr:hypothetical protein GJAV_G00263730 [Gymnothorax javanicus]
MSVDAASDFLTDEELEDLGEDGLSVFTYMSETEKQPRKKKTSSKPPSSPKSPYLSSANLRTKKAAVWRSLKGTGMMHTENPTARTPREFWLASIKSGLALSQPLKVDYDATSARMSTSTSTPEYLKVAFGMKKPKHSRTSSNGYIPGTPDFKEKEDMYDEILELKKSLQSQKSENDLMKTKLRKLEEDNLKKEKQIEQLLNPTKGAEYTRSFADKRNDGSGVINGLKQKILKLEQQCKDKDSALTKLQSDLKTTNMEEMKIAVETYFEEIQRLKVLLASAETAERSTRAERKESLKQQKVLNSSILRLSNNTKQLQEENKSLREELERVTENRSSSARGYGEWSKQRLVRRIIELEKKIEDPGRSEAAKESNSASGPRATHVNAVVTSSEPAVRGVTATPSANDLQECARLRGLLKKLREERAGLQASLADRIAEINALSTEKAEADKEASRLKACEQDAAHYKQEMEKMAGRVMSLEKELQAERSLRAEVEQRFQVLEAASSSNVSGQCQNCVGQTEESSAYTPASLQRHRSADGETEDWAARTIQRHWHQYKSRNENGEHSEEDLVIIQSAIRGHLARRNQLAYFEEHKCQNKLWKGQQSEFTEGSAVDGGEDDDAVILVQAALRAHLARQHIITSSASSAPVLLSADPRKGNSVPTPAPIRLLSATHSSTPGVSNSAGSDEEIEEDLPDVTELGTDENFNSTDFNLQSTTGEKTVSAAQFDPPLTQ